jgi:hypothetical protein
MIQELISFYKFKENTVRLIKSRSASFLKHKDKFIKTNYPTIYNDLKTYYETIFKSKCDLNGCAITFIEKFTELNQLSLSEIIYRMELKSKLKDGKVFQIDNVYYTSKAKHLTNEVCDRIYSLYGMSAFEYYEKASDERAKEMLKIMPEKITSAELSEYFEEVKYVGTEKEKQVIKKSYPAKKKTAKKKTTKKK